MGVAAGHSGPGQRGWYPGQGGCDGGQAGSPAGVPGSEDGCRQCEKRGAASLGPKPTGAGGPAQGPDCACLQTNKGADQVTLWLSRCSGLWDHLWEKELPGAETHTDGCSPSSSTRPLCFPSPLSPSLSHVPPPHGAGPGRPGVCPWLCGGPRPDSVVWLQLTPRTTPSWVSCPRSSTRQRSSSSEAARPATWPWCTARRRASGR